MIKKNKKTYCFDIDNTICRTIKSNYKKSKPIKKNIDFINFLYEQGNIIKIYTARYMGRNLDNVNKAKKEGMKLTENQLKKWSIKYHLLIMGKPSFDILVDDKSIFFKKNWPTYIKKIVSY